MKYYQSSHKLAAAIKIKVERRTLTIVNPTQVAIKTRKHKTFHSYILEMYM